MDKEEKNCLPAEDEIYGRLKQATDKEYMLLFQILSARELPLYPPAKKAERAALKALVPFFESKDGVRQAVEILEEQERLAPCPPRVAGTEQYVRLLRQRAGELGRDSAPGRTAGGSGFSALAGLRELGQRFEACGVIPADR